MPAKKVRWYFIARISRTLTAGVNGARFFITVKATKIVLVIHSSDNCATFIERVDPAKMQNYAETKILAPGDSASSRLLFRAPSAGGGIGGFRRQHHGPT